MDCKINTKMDIRSDLTQFESFKNSRIKDILEIEK